MWWEFRFFQELLPGVFYKTDGCFVAFYFHCDDFIICPPAAPSPTRRNLRVLLTDPIPGFPFHTRAISALQQRCISSTLATCATRLCLITNFARHRKRHHPSLPSRHLPLSRPRRRKRSSGSSYYHYLCARARHQLSVFGFGLSIERLF